MRIRTLHRNVAAAALIAVLPACGGNGLGGVGDILGGVLGGGAAGAPQQGQIRAEIQSVNTQQQAINVRDENGQTGSVLFDQSTVVVYQQQQYPVTALERGDIVQMQVQQIDQNRLYTARIDVQQSVQERTGQTSSSGGQMQQLSGTVQSVDRQNGFFTLRSQSSTYTVVIPSNADALAVTEFSNLRAGDAITIQGTVTGSTRIDLYRFLNV